MRIVFSFTLAALATLSALAGAGAGEAAPLSPELAAALTAARDDYRAGRYAAALATLAAYDGPDHPARRVLMGHAQSMAGDFAAAAAEYGRALALDPGDRAAGVGRAQARARLGDWAGALADAGRFIDPEKATAGEVVFFARVAAEHGDAPLAGRLARRARERFPLDEAAARLELSLILRDGDWRAAARAGEALVLRFPDDAGLWAQYGAAAHGAGDAATAAAAAEAAWLLERASPERFRDFLAAALAAGQGRAVVAEGEKIVAGATGYPPETPELQALFAAAAEQTGDDAALALWLGRVPKEGRSRGLALAAARLSLRQGRPEEARAALKELLAATDVTAAADAAVLLWAARLDEDAGDLAAAEAAYRLAAAPALGPALAPGAPLAAPAPAQGIAPARLAALHLARFLAARGRAPEAREILSRYLERWPEDDAARALRASLPAAPAKRLPPPAPGIN